MKEKLKKWRKCNEKIKRYVCMFVQIHICVYVEVPEEVNRKSEREVIFKEIIRIPRWQRSKWKLYKLELQLNFCSEKSS